MPQGLLKAEAGLREQSDLLGAILPRVSPEYIMVASALDGILREHPDLDVRMERPIPRRPRQKCDLVVRPRDGGAPY